MKFCKLILLNDVCSCQIYDWARQLCLNQFSLKYQILIGLPGIARVFYCQLCQYCQLCRFVSLSCCISVSIFISPLYLSISFLPSIFLSLHSISSLHLFISTLYLSPLSFYLSLPPTPYPDKQICFTSKFGHIYNYIVE